MNRPFPLDAFPLETTRLRLREFCADDVDDVFAYTSDPEVTRHLILETQHSREEAVALLARALENYHGETPMWAIEYKADRRVAGGCGMRNWDRGSARVEISYALARRYWGQGIMGEALGALIGFGFDRMRLNRIEAHTRPTNTASCRMLEKLGFLREGIMRQHEFFKGVHQDLALYSLLANDWRKPVQA